MTDTYPTLTFTRPQWWQDLFWLMINVTAMKPNKQIINLSKQTVPSPLSLSWKSYRLNLKFHSLSLTHTHRFVYPWVLLPLGDPENECQHVLVTSCRQTIAQLSAVCPVGTEITLPPQKKRCMKKGAQAHPPTLKIAYSTSAGWANRPTSSRWHVHWMDNCVQSIGGDILEMSCTGIINIPLVLAWARAVTGSKQSRQAGRPAWLARRREIYYGFHQQGTLCGTHCMFKGLS